MVTVQGMKTPETESDLKNKVISIAVVTYLWFSIPVCFLYTAYLLSVLGLRYGLPSQQLLDSCFLHDRQL